MDAKLTIRIEYSEDGLFGAYGTDGYDVPASMRQFSAELTNFVYDRYPQAEIEILQANRDRITVDGMTDHEEVPWIEQLVEKVWNEQPWEVRVQE